MRTETEERKMELLLGAPGLILAFIFAFMERRGAAWNARAQYSLDNVLAVAFMTSLSCFMIAYLMLTILRVTPDDLATGIIASVITLRLMEGPAKFAVLKLCGKTV